MAYDLNDTLVFVKVVEQGSFIAAARALGLPKTTVSRKVQDLEARLGAQLLHRTTRRLGLTEAGNVYFEHCQRIAQELEEAEGAVGQLQGGPRGWLRFTVPYSIGIAWISPLLGQFHAQYPEIRLDMHMSNDPVDLIGSEIDVALRIGPLPDSTLIARRLAGFRTQVFASPSYIERHGEPLHPDELQHHRILAVRKHYHSHPTRITWPLSDGNGVTDYPINPLMVANDPSALIGAVLCGEGLTLATDVAAKPYVESGALRRVLAGWTGPEVDFSAVFPRGRVMSPKVRAFVDFLVERLSSNADYMLVHCPSRCAAEAAREAGKEEASVREGKRILEEVVG
ncbi:LysR family transcriptional regulator [Pseudoxanthomonas sp. SGNA-20]|jgi:Transcriptional regulator|uniref:LysR family transcriptional regulator n=1 Tax=unclassified Pseudoxanthomonas TaxID=2645906 RepID=UPI000308BF5C|nr:MULTISPECIES: LysR family transcriptional regulator [unclassified Pseudoxanthomonas]RRN57186.1 LysR family transcriptional regulator [Pseudoxanthomonas sp. SGNA-20]RRN80020.1 LysR family transcriptional regulator [Pseudoxanthomonas sp. SGD-10]